MSLLVTMGLGPSGSEFPATVENVIPADGHLAPLDSITFDVVETGESHAALLAITYPGQLPRVAFSVSEYETGFVGTVVDVEKGRRRYSFRFLPRWPSAFSVTVYLLHGE